MSDNPQEPATPVTPAAAPPQQQAAIPVADLTGALVGAYNQIIQSQPRQQHVPTNPLDAMTAEQRQQLNDRFLTDPLGAARYVQDITTQAVEQRIYQQAIPLIQTSANGIVETFKTKKQRSDPYFAKIEPLFDRLMVGVDITPLVNMNQATRDHELELRWKNARADVLDAELKRAKPEPTLLSDPGTNQPANPVADSPWLANMKAQYKFTDAQIAEILNG
jgi:hypothetical protein